MDQPVPQPQAPPLSTTPHLPYPDSIASSPRSRTTESWDDGGSKLRLMCSYGGHIVPRPHDKSLCYVGGDTRMVVVDRHSSLSDISSRLSKTLLHGRLFTLKYQIPSDDLDSLISVTSDDDLDNMIDEYDRICSNNSSLKFARIRLFLFPTKHESSSSTIEVGSIFNNSMKSEDWFVSALNGSTGALNGGFADSLSVNSLLGLDNEAVTGGFNGGSLGSRDNSQAEFDASNRNLKQGGHDVHTVPDSPMFETTSSFGSTSSSPALAYLQPIRVHLEDTAGGGGGVRVPDQKMGIEEQFAHISLAAQKPDEGLAGLSSPSTLMPPPIVALPVTSAMPLSSAGGGGEYRNPVFSDTESLEQGMPVGYKRPPQPQAQPLLQTMILPHQPQQKPTGGVELPSPDSVSSDSNLTNIQFHQNPTIYQESIASQSMNNTDPPKTRAQIHQQVQESGYVMQPHLEQQQHQQYIHGGVQYISHHPSGQVPISSYYPIYPPPQQRDHQYPAVYYMPTRQAYNFPIQQPNFTEPLPTTPSSRPQNTIPTYNVPPPKTEMAAGAYRPAAVAPQLVQVSQNQHHQQQYITANYAYEFADPAHAQIYYTQPYAPSLLPAQYQTMEVASAVGLPEASPQLISDQMKEQIRTTQV